MNWYGDTPIENLLGKTIVSVERSPSDEELTFKLDGGGNARMWHSQDCCEHVYLAEVIGDLNDLVGSPITQAECETNSEIDPPEYAESFTWTFYKLATVKGYVTLRWLGESNGYYSESVDFHIEEPETAA